MMVLLQMREAGMLREKSVLVIDPDARVSNDRTWCFWEPEGGPFDEIAHRQWDHAYFIDSKTSWRMPLAPYRYKMVRGSDFFAHARKKLDGCFEASHEKVVAWEDFSQGATVQTQTESFSCTHFFNSIFDENQVAGSPHYYLRQHFIGWTVRTQNPVFDPDAPTFMDFSVPQNGNTRFMYVLPLSQNEALVEYTLFSKDLLDDEEYERAIDQYLQNLNSGEYDILEKERGSIPMTVFRFHKQNTEHVTFIGSAGGWTKPSTGFTFANTVKRSAELIRAMKDGRDTQILKPKPRFNFYDALLIDVLYHENHRGSEIFSALFKDGKPAPIFKFLDEDTSFAEDLKILIACPKGIFIRALWRHLIR